MVYGPELTTLSWNKEDNTLSMSSLVNATNVEWYYGESYFKNALTIHLYSQLDQCLAAPLKEYDPVTVANCIVENQEQLMRIHEYYILKIKCVLIGFNIKYC
ncbi:7184_t:CDS:2 [Entrophospora sp. SA101]|nr:2082_t:CDS:2 [Entrophospora sp. SA101]CAJ0628527.1 7184_t:CDS:2 [Entrophospora sp. SA101]CAJ0837359.1 7123_t:CDS:2 [Entrophospora sp. SA101]CAJ0911060.1 3899_t:CDS:2 [Entrophospora sp. SA101]